MRSYFHYIAEAKSAETTAVDMPSTTLPTTPPEMLHRLLDSVFAGNDVMLFTDSDSGQKLLDLAADRLARLRSRVLRVAAAQSGGLGLPGLMAQVTGRPGLSLQDDEILKQGFQAFTALDATCDRIVLVVTGANALQRATLRYIQFACSAGPNLQIVLASNRGFLDLLDVDELADLRARLLAATILTLPAAFATGPAATAAPAARHAPETAKPPPNIPMLVASATVPHQRRRLAARAAIGLGVAAALGVWIGRDGWQAMSSQPSQLVAQPLNFLEVTPPPAAGTPPPDSAALHAATDAAPVAPKAPPPQSAAVAGEASAPATAPAPSLAPSVDATPVPAPSLPAPPRALVPASKQVARQPPELRPGSHQSAARRSRFAQSRVEAETPADAENSREWDRPYTPPPQAWQPWQPWQPPEAAFDPGNQPIARPQPYIGTYSTGANGIRTFHFGP